MLFKFIPQEFDFFELFEKQASYALDAAKFFKELALKGSVDEQLLEKMHQIEQQGDETAHKLLEQLDKTFITPFDREDIHALVKELDDVIDTIYAITSRLKVYKINKVDPNLTEFASLIQQSISGVLCAVGGLRKSKNTKAVFDSCMEISRLENVGDTLRDKLIGDLFENEKDPIVIIKMKEIYQGAETVLDICEDVAHIVSSIMVKQA